jgi:hypothetical protein
MSPVIIPKIGTSVSGPGPCVIGIPSRQLTSGAAFGQQALRKVESFLGLTQLLPEHRDLLPQILELKLRLAIGPAANPLRKAFPISLRA